MSSTLLWPRGAAGLCGNVQRIVSVGSGVSQAAWQRASTQQQQPYRAASEQHACARWTQHSCASTLWPTSTATRMATTASILDKEQGLLLKKLLSQKQSKRILQQAYEHAASKKVRPRASVPPAHSPPERPLQEAKRSTPSAQQPNKQTTNKRTDPYVERVDFDQMEPGWNVVHIGPPDPNDFVKMSRILRDIRMFNCVAVVMVLVYLCWQAGHWRLEHRHDSRLLAFMVDNMTCTLDNLRSGRVWTLFTASFSHADIGQVLLSALGLRFFTFPLLFSLPRSVLVGCWLLSGAITSAAGVLLERRLRSRDDANDKRHTHMANGAGGAILSFVGFGSLTTMFMFNKPNIEMLLPLRVRQWVVLPIYLAIDFSLAYAQNDYQLNGSLIDFGSHAAGAATGVLLALSIITRAHRFQRLLSHKMNINYFK